MADPVTNTGDPALQDAKTRIQGYLDDFGLNTPALSEWLWNQIVQGHSNDTILADLRGRPEWKARFPGNELRKEKGLPLLSPSTYVQYEQQARQTMRTAGMPAGFYDSPDDFAKMVGNDVSINEIQDRVTKGFQVVMDAPPQVRAAFQSFYGANTDGAMAAYFLDPDRAEPLLLKEARAAQAKGYSDIHALAQDQAQSEFVADLNLSDQQLRQGYQQLGEIRGVFDESVGETNTGAKDISTGKEGVEAMFQAGTGKEDVTKRLEERSAALSGKGGTVQTQRGFTGLGEAERT